MKILITGVAGFIGSNLAELLLLDENNIVLGVDNLNSYYDIKIKENRLTSLMKCKNFYFEKINIANADQFENIFETFLPEIVIHLAAQAGVRYSLENPQVYIESNIVGFQNLVENCRKFPVKHCIYASSSSVYGANKKVPFQEDDRVDNPVSLYAATKKSNELVASTYSHLFNIPFSGLRFFTVYGPGGRPDMAYFTFLNKYFDNEPISIYNNGDFDNDLYRDFTYIDDIVHGIMLLIDKVPIENGRAFNNILNIGNNQPVKLMKFIRILEESLSKSMASKITFDKKFEKIKDGDVPATYASTDKLHKLTGYKPSTPLDHGLSKFTDWYVDFYDKKTFEEEN